MATGDGERVLVASDGCQPGPELSSGQGEESTVVHCVTSAGGVAGLRNRGQSNEVDDDTACRSD